MTAFTRLGTLVMPLAMIGLLSGFQAAPRAEE